MWWVPLLTGTFVDCCAELLCSDLLATELLLLTGDHLSFVCLTRLVAQVKKKMSAEDFLKNNRGINDGQDLPPEFMRSLYERIVSNEIQVRCNMQPLVFACCSCWRSAVLAAHRDIGCRAMAGSMCSCCVLLIVSCMDWLVHPCGVLLDKVQLSDWCCDCACSPSLSCAWNRRSRTTWWMLPAPRLQQRQRSAATC
jgi:hypothetical protein